MKNIVLKKLELTNYRNIDHIELNFDGNSKIIGENRIGKTNVLEAIYYLFTDKLLDCSNNISLIKPLDDTSKEVRVKGTFYIWESKTPEIPPQEITLEKQYGEDWVKTRGTSELVLKGHYCNYLYNGVKQNTLKIYNGLLAEDFGIEPNKMQFDVMQMLVNPFYLGNMGETDKWNDLRASIIELVGNVTNDDVFRENPQLHPIEQDMADCNGRVEQLKKKIESEISGLKENISVGNAQMKMLKETPHPTEEELAIAKKAIEESDEKVAAISYSSIDVVSEDLKKEINTLEAELVELKKKQLESFKKNSVVDSLEEKYDSLYKEKESLLTKKNTEQDVYLTLKNEIRGLELQLKTCQEKRNAFIDSLKSIDERIRNINIEDVCPVCHRPYEAAVIEEHKKQAISDLENQKASILLQGKENKARMAEINQEIENKSKLLLEKEQVLESLKKDVESVIDDLNQLKDKIYIEKNKFYELDKPAAQAELEEKIAAKKEELRQSQADFYQGQRNAQALVDQEKAKAEPYRKVVADNDFYIRQMENLETVKAQKAEHQRKLADAEQKKELVKTFTIEKLRMLDENVSRVFGNIRFQLIRENINGGFDTICKPYIYDIDNDKSTDTTWKSGSKSERVITGIAIAECIKAALNLPNLPYLFDEGGEISTETFKTKFKTDSQIICVKIVDNIMRPTVEKI